MKSRLGLLLVMVVLASALVLAVSGYNHKAFTGSRPIEPAGPLVPFEDYSKMDSKRDRAAAFAKESPHGKALLWKQHLAYYEARLQLNQQQKDFLKRVSEFLDERVFAAPIGMSEAKYLKAESGKAFKELMQNVPRLFTQKQASQLFLVVGDNSTITNWGCGAPKVQTDESNGAKVRGPNASEPNRENSSSLPLPTCSCTGSICGSGCIGLSTCWMNLPESCSSGGSCGCFGLFNCTGQCGGDLGLD